MVVVADKIEGGCFGCRDLHRAARSIEALNGHLLQVLADDETHPHPTALHRAARALKQNLEFLRPLVRRPVVLRGGQ